MPAGSEPHQVAPEPDEVDPHGDAALRVAAESLDLVHQIGTELVSPFQHTQNYDVVLPQVVHDVSGKTLRPGDRARKRSLMDEFSMVFRLEL